MTWKGRLKRGGAASVTLFVIVILVVVFRGLFVQSKQPIPQAPKEFAPNQGFEQRLSEAIRIPTVSDPDSSKMDFAKWDELFALIESVYPKVHQTLVRQKVGECSWVYEWKAGQGAESVLFLAHTDVVPEEEEKLKGWEHPPFSGHIDGEFIWGRGALDDKVSVFGMLEALEVLASRGYAPKRNIVLGFGCDEEVGGHLGAKAIKAHFEKEERRFVWSMDEGHIIGDGFFPGVDRPVAFIGLAEKGFVTLELSAEGEGGHSSMPGKQTAVGILARAISKLEENPFPARLTPPVEGMLAHLAPEVNGPLRWVFANLWILEPLILRVFAGKPSTNATVRTTTALTVFHGGVRENILPKTASAKVNFRILPGDTKEGVLERAKDLIDDERVRIEVPERGFNSNPTVPSSIDGPGYAVISQSIRNVWQDGVFVAPSLTVGGTDSRHFEPLADDTYRFLPLVLTPTDTPRIHGVNERVSIEGYENAIRLYAEVFQRLSE